MNGKIMESGTTTALLFIWEGLCDCMALFVFIDGMNEMLMEK